MRRAKRVRRCLGHTSESELIRVLIDRAAEHLGVYHDEEAPRLPPAFFVPRLPRVK